MRQSVISGLICVAIGLSGCANKGDVDSSASSAVIVAPSGVSSPTKESYYKVPPVSSSGTAEPSLVPPGSNVQKDQEALKNKQAQAEPVAEITVSSVELKQKPDPAYAAVGQALATEKYHVLSHHDESREYDVAAVNPGESIESNTLVYHIMVEPTDSHSVLTVRDQNHLPVQNDIEKHMLQNITRNLA